MSIAAPDAAGFVEATDRLRSQLGTPITFKVPTAPTWPGGTKINPATGEPYDATIKRENAEFTDVVKTCLIILKQASPLRPQPDSQFSAAGELSGMDIIIDIADQDYPAVKEAAELVANNLTYRIVEAKPFSIGPEPYRFLIYAEEM